MDLPSEFTSNIRNVFQERGDTFLTALPALIAEAAAKWGLTNVEPAPTLSYNFVAFAKRGAQDVVLKMGVPNRELLSEREALRLFNGNGACQLLDYDEEKYWLLLERLNPGLMLATLNDDEEATHIAAEVMKKIWRPLSQISLHDDEGDPSQGLRMTDTTKFIQLSDWFGGLKELRQKFEGGTGPLDERIVARVEELVRELFAENHQPVLMHGDFHHYNVLSSERGWLIIDPKGVIGPAGYEVGPLLMNPWGELESGINYRQITKRRIDILHEHLGFERRRIHAWGLAHAVLSTWWSIEDNTGWEYSAAFAKMMADLDVN